MSVDAPPNVGWGLSGACDVGRRGVIGRCGLGTAAVALDRRPTGSGNPISTGLDPLTRFGSGALKNTRLAFAMGKTRDKGTVKTCSATNDSGSPRRYRRYTIGIQ